MRAAACVELPVVTLAALVEVADKVSLLSAEAVTFWPAAVSAMVLPVTVAVAAPCTTLTPRTPLSTNDLPLPKLLLLLRPLVLLGFVELVVTSSWVFAVMVAASVAFDGKRAAGQRDVALVADADAPQMTSLKETALPDRLQAELVVPSVMVALIFAVSFAEIVRPLAAVPSGEVDRLVKLR